MLRPIFTMLSTWGLYQGSIYLYSLSLLVLPKISLFTVKVMPSLTSQSAPHTSPKFNCICHSLTQLPRWWRSPCNSWLPSLSTIPLILMSCANLQPCLIHPHSNHYAGSCWILALTSCRYNSINFQWNLCCSSLQGWLLLNNGCFGHQNCNSCNLSHGLHCKARALRMDCFLIYK